MKFPARLDTVAKVISWLVLIVVIVPFVVIIRMAVVNGMPELFIGPVVVTAALVWAALYRITGYSISEGNLIIHRPAMDRVVPLADVQDLQLADRKTLGNGIRAFGSGGFLGYFGLFVYRNAGNAWMYATDRSKLLLLRLQNSKQILISPDDTEGFVSAFNKAKGIRFPGNPKYANMRRD